MFSLERNEAIERGVGQTLSLFESFLQHEAVSITRRSRANGTVESRASLPASFQQKTYAAARCANARLRNSEASTLPASSEGQTSLAPASSAAIHISSSGTRWVQTIDSSGKSRRRL